MLVLIHLRRHYEGGLAQPHFAYQLFDNCYVVSVLLCQDLLTLLLCCISLQLDISHPLLQLIKVRFSFFLRPFELLPMICFQVLILFDSL